MPACQPSSLAVCPAVCWGDEMPGPQTSQCYGSLLNKVSQWWGTLGLPAVHHKARLVISLKGGQDQGCLPWEGQERYMPWTSLRGVVNEGWGGIRPVRSTAKHRFPFVLVSPSTDTLLGVLNPIPTEEGSTKLPQSPEDWSRVLVAFPE